MKIHALKFIKGAGILVVGFEENMGNISVGQ